MLCVVPSVISTDAVDAQNARETSLATTRKPPTKTEILTDIADAAGLTKKEVGEVFDALSENIKKNLGRRGPGAYTIPGLLKIEKKRVPARKAQRGVPNPFKPGELMDVAARPASNKVKVRPLKSLKDMV